MRVSIAFSVQAFVSRSVSALDLADHPAQVPRLTRAVDTTSIEIVLRRFIELFLDVYADFWAGARTETTW